MTETTLNEPKDLLKEVKDSLASASDDEAISKILLTPIFYGYTAIQVAVALRDTAAIEYFLNLAPNAETRRKMLLPLPETFKSSTLGLAARLNHPETIKPIITAILKTPSDESLTNNMILVFIAAAALGYTETVKAILEALPDDEARSKILFAQNKRGNTALMEAAKFRQTETAQVLRDACPEDTINKMLSIKNNDGKTAWNLLREKFNSDLELNNVPILGLEMFVLMQLKGPTDSRSVAVNQHQPESGRVQGNG